MDGSSVGFLTHIIDFIVRGGAFMYVILAVWFFGIVVIVERYKKLKGTFDVDGPSFMNEIQRYVLSNDVEGAIRVCSGSEAALPRVLKSGLKRANQGVEQIQNALDATALEVVPKVEMRLPHLQLAANISTLLGLLGTIFGLIDTFTAVGAADPSQKAELLSAGISVAMNTTALGLISAISIMIFHAILNSKAEKITNEIDEFSVKLLDLLGTKEKN